MESSSVESPPSIRRKRPTKGIDVVDGIKRDVEVSSASRFGQVFVFPFRVYDYHFRIKHQASQNFQLGGVRLSRTGFGENDGIVIFQRKPVKKHQAVVVAVDAVKNSFVRRQVKRNEREKAGNGRRIKLGADIQFIRP